MESKIMLEIGKRLELRESVALVTLTKTDGSSPGRQGNIMSVFQDGTTLGTVGGGNLEYMLTQKALECIESGESEEAELDLVDDASLHMKCGGTIKAFIKIFKKKDNLIIVGGGHVGTEIYKLGDYLDMSVIIFDDRKKFCNKDKFPNADSLILGDIKDTLKEYKVEENSYIIIVTRGHQGDKDALRELIKSNYKYLGMIGSRKKIRETYDELEKEGLDRELLESIYSPIGLDISNGSPKEIAFSIMAEILKVKNNRTGKAMKEVKIVKKGEASAD